VLMMRPLSVSIHLPIGATAAISVYGGDVQQQTVKKKLLLSRMPRF
jgi:hypothetical protein